MKLPHPDSVFELGVPLFFNETSHYKFVTPHSPTQTRVCLTLLPKTCLVKRLGLNFQ